MNRLPFPSCGNPYGNIPSHPYAQQMILTIGPYDILCGRCRSAFNNVGNRRFRVTISLNFQRYINARNRSEKTEVVVSIVRILKHDVGARFLKPCPGGYFIELSEKEARDKVGHALRDMVSSHKRCDLRPSKRKDSQSKSERRSETFVETRAPKEGASGKSTSLLNGVHLHETQQHNMLAFIGIVAPAFSF